MDFMELAESGTWGLMNVVDSDNVREFQNLQADSTGQNLVNAGQRKSGLSNVSAEVIDFSLNIKLNHARNDLVKTLLWRTTYRLVIPI